MLEVNGNIKDFQVKDKEVVIKIHVNKSGMTEPMVSELFMLSQEPLKVAIMRKPYYEKWREDGQTDFEVKCPDCDSYDCLIGTTLAVCHTCDKEFKIQERIKKEESVDEQTNEENINEILESLEVVPENDRFKGVFGEWSFIADTEEEVREELRKFLTDRFKDEEEETIEEPAPEESPEDMAELQEGDKLIKTDNPDEFVVFSVNEEIPSDLGAKEGDFVVEGEKIVEAGKKLIPDIAEVEEEVTL